jgi:hypothetical protein
MKQRHVDLSAVGRGSWVVVSKAKKLVTERNVLCVRSAAVELANKWL